jgi:hypothetical protein
MADTFEQSLENVRNEEVTTPTPVDPTPTPVGNDAPQTGTPDTNELPQSVRDYLAQNPDHAPIVETLNKQFQAAFTPRLQDAADLRKRYEGVDDNVMAAVRHLQQLIQTDPRNAAEYLRQQAVLLEGSQTPQAQPDPANVPEFATDVEELLYNKYLALEAKFQREEEQRQVIQVNTDFAKLEQEYGVQVPIEARAAAWEMSVATQGKLSVQDAYFALNRNTLLPTLTQKARDEASGVVQQKLGLTAPGNLATRGGAPQVEGPQDFEYYFGPLRNG